MRNNDHAMYEQYLFLEENAKSFNDKQTEKVLKESEEREDFYNKINTYRKQKELENLKKIGLSESLYDEYLGDAFKAIYISALGEITKESKAMASDQVDKYIKENGGARTIMRKNSGKTYLLDTIFEMVREAHDKELIRLYEEELLVEAEENDKKKNNDEEVNVDFEDDDEGFKDADKKEEPKKEEVPDDTPEEVPEEAPEKEPDEKPDKPEETPESEEEPAEDDEVSDKEVDSLVDDLEDDSVADGDFDTDEENKEEEEIEDQDTNGKDDEPDAMIDDVPGKEPKAPESTKEDLFDQMEQEDDINSAVDLIAQRVQSAEAEFIEKNASDKKKIEKIVDNLGERLKGATEDPDKKPDISEKQQLEATRMISNIRENRYHTVFEEMVKQNYDYILKHEDIKEDYTLEDGSIDTAAIVESSKVLYGFVEFVNTIQLEDVNEKFIKELLEN